MKTGKVIIRAVADDAARERVVAFVCAHARNATADGVRRGLARMPLVVAGPLEAGKGERLAVALTGLGADAVFQGDGPAMSSAPAAGDGGQPPVRPSRPRPERKKPLTPAQAAEAEKLRVARNCRLALGYAMLAVLVPMLSPLFFALSLPLALYAAHRSAALLGSDIWLRVVYLPAMFVPVINLVVLALLLFQVQRFIGRSTVSLDRVRDELAGLRFALRAGYAGVMAVFIVGTAGGYLPHSTDALRETVEKKLARAVERSANDFPRRVDRELRIDRMSAGPGRRLTFHCTMLATPSSRIDGERFRTSISSTIVERVCSNREMEYFLTNGVTVAYAFNGSDDLPIATVNVADSDCAR